MTKKCRRINFDEINTNVEIIDIKSTKKYRRINFDKINTNVETIDMKSTKKLMIVK